MPAKVRCRLGVAIEPSGLDNSNGGGTDLGHRRLGAARTERRRTGAGASDPRRNFPDAGHTEFVGAGYPPMAESEGVALNADGSVSLRVERRTPAWVFAELRRQGTRLPVCDDGIELSDSHHVADPVLSQ